MSYITLAEVKAHAQIMDNARDADLLRLIEAASRFLDRAIGVPDGAFRVTVASSRTFFLPQPARHLVSDVPMLQLQGAFYRSAPSGPEQDFTGRVVLVVSMFGTDGPGRVFVRTDGVEFSPGWWRLLGLWGVSQVPPADIAHAAVILALSWLRKGPTHYAVESISALEGRVVAGDDIPQEVQSTIQRWQAQLGLVP
ncbi:MAG: head-tail connector protein [Anaerolineae bacterium]|nr:head-tail connector protein [Anaerolineae bacterium]